MAAMTHLLFHCYVYCLRFGRLAILVAHSLDPLRVVLNMGILRRAESNMPSLISSCRHLHCKMRVLLFRWERFCHIEARCRCLCWDESFNNNYDRRWVEGVRKEEFQQGRTNIVARTVYEIYSFVLFKKKYCKLLRIPI